MTASTTRRAAAATRTDPPPATPAAAPRRAADPRVAATDQRTDVEQAHSRGRRTRPPWAG